MSKSSHQKGRIIALLDILQKYTDEEHSLNAAEIIEHLSFKGFDCDRKTVYDDIETLKDLDYDILLNNIGHKGYFLASREFELPEVSLLTDAVSAADFISPSKSEKLIKKLKGLLSSGDADKLRKNVFLNNSIKCNNEEIYYSIDNIRNAILKNKKITLSYVRHNLNNGHFINSTSKEMKVSPYALAWMDDHYYLIANNEKYNDLMHLRVDRMRSVKINDEDFRHFSEVSDYKDEFNVSDYVQKTFNMFSGKSIELTLKCNIKFLEQIIDRFGDEIFIRSSDDDRFIFDTKAFESFGLISWLLSMGDNIEVVSPEHIRKELLNSAEKIMKLNS